MSVSTPATLSRREVIPIVIILGLVVLAWTLDSLLNPMIKSTDLNIMATIVSKDMQPTLYARDNLFAGDELYRLYTPLYRWLIAQAWQLGGSFEMGLAWLVPPVLGIFLGGMFLLFWQLTRRLWITLALTLACAYYHPLAMGAEVWGIGGSTEMMSRTLFLPALPFIVILFLRALEYPHWLRAALAGLALGLAANLHPVSGFHLLALLSLWLLAAHGHQRQGWLALLALGLAALLGASPVSWNFLRHSGQAVDQTVTFAAFSQIVAERYPMPFYPQAFKWSWVNLELTRPVLDILAWFYPILALLCGLSWLWSLRRQPGLIPWLWLLGGLVTLAYAYMIALFNTSLIFGLVLLYLFYRFWRGQYTRQDGWFIVLMGLTVLYAFVGYYGLTYIWQQFEVWALTSLLVEYARAARFIYLSVYGLAGLALTAWVDELKGLGRVNLAFNRLRRLSVGGLWGLVIVMVLTLFGPLAPQAANLPLPARNFLDSANWVAKPVTNPTDAALYDWVRQNTPSTALFYGCFGPETMTYFRRHTQRSITHNWKDLTFAVHNRATLLAAYSRFRQLEAACQTFERVVSTAHTLNADYLLISSRDAAAFVREACFVNDKYAVFSLQSPGCASQ